MNSLRKVQTSLSISIIFCLWISTVLAMGIDRDQLNILTDDPDFIQKALNNSNYDTQERVLRDLDFSFQLIAYAEYDPYDFTAVWNPTQGSRGLCAGSDLDGDGHQEIFAVHYGNGGGVVGFEMEDGETLEMIWNSTLSPTSYNLGTRYVQTGDMDGDGLGEIIFFRGKFADDPNRGLYIYEWDGTDNGYALAYHNPLTSLSGDLVSEMVIEHFLIRDVDDDNQDELIFASNGLSMGADRSEDFFSILSIDGDIGSGSEVLTEEYWISPRDVDDDGVIEDGLGGGSGLNIQVCDTDNDGHKEVFCHAYNYFNMFFFEALGPDRYTLGDTTNIQFTYPSDDAQLMNAAVSDLDGDGADEIYIGNWMTGDVYMIQDTDGDATSLLTSEITVLGENVGAKFGALAFDFDSSGTDEIYFGSSAGLGADLRVWDGEQFMSYYTDPVSDGFLPKMDVADMNGNGIPELITAHQMVTNDPQRIIRVSEYLPDDPSHSRWAFAPVYNVGYTDDWGSSYAPILGDYDNDGFVDVFVTNGGVQQNTLYHNSGFGYFNRIWNGDISSDANWSSSATWGDFDNDDDLDLYVTNSGGDAGETNALYRNDGNDNFQKITEGNIATDQVMSSGATWGDYDNDGYLDLYVANPEGVNHLYHNEGDGSFSRVSVGWIVFDQDVSSHGSWCDYDNDGDLDMYVVNCGPNALYRNEGGGTFTKIQTGALVTDNDCSGGASWADYDNDGDFDVFVTAGYDEPNCLYRNEGGGVFSKITVGAIVNDDANSHGSTWGDLDNDGDLDLFVANNAEPNPQDNFVYINDGDGGFTGVYDNLINYNDLLPVGCSWGDYNNDGDIDLFIGIDGGRNVLFANQGNSNSWVNIKCVGTISNRSAIGAKVRAKANILGSEVWQVNEISGQSGAFSQNSLNVEFGFADADIIDSLRIEWPSGLVNEYSNIQVDEFYVIREGEALQVSADTLDYGQVFLGGDYTMELEFSNQGPMNISVEDFAIDNPAFSSNLETFELEPNDTTIVSITFDPSETGTYEALLTFTSDDPLVPGDTIMLYGVAVLAPDIDFSPDSIHVTLLPGALDTVTITIDNIAGESPLYWTANLETNGIEHTLTFTKADYADWRLPENQDRITDNVWITRAGSQGIFNAATESYFDFYQSPWGTEWAYGYSTDLNPEDYEIWRDAISAYPPGMIEQPISVHLISDDIYLDVEFHSWTSGGNGGGFSYTRTASSPEWISLSPQSGSLDAGQSVAVELVLNATGLPAGTQFSDIIINSNDPDESEITIPVELDISAAPDIYVEKDTLDFGNVYNGYSDTLAIPIENLGSANLLISNATVDLPEYQLNSQSFEILHEATYMLEVILTPSSSGDYTGALTLTTTDPDEELYTITLLGSSLDPPVVGLTPDSLFAALLTDESNVQSMTVANTGLSALTYEIRATSVENSSRGRSMLDLSRLDGPRYSWDELVGGNFRPPSPAENNWGRAEEPGSHANNQREQTVDDLRDLRESWKLLYTDPEELGPIDVQYVYGSTTSDEMLIKIEGYSVFDEMVCAIYIDLDQNRETGIDTEEDEMGWYLGVDYAIISTGMGFDGFFIVDDDDLVFLDNLTTNIVEANSTERILGVDIGYFENISAYNFAMICDGGVEDIVPDFGAGHITFPLSTPWLAFDPEIGTIDAGDQEEISVTFDASGMYGGDYYSQITVLSNDPDSPEITANAHLTVTGIPNIEFELAAFHKTSLIQWYEAGAATSHHFETTFPAIEDGNLTICVDGDFDSDSEWAEVYLEDDLIGIINPYTDGGTCEDITLSMDDLNTSIENGEVTIRVMNSQSVDPGDWGDFHEVTLSYHGAQDSLDFGEVYQGYEGSRNIIIHNTGTDTLLIEGVTVDNTVFSISAPVSALPWDETNTLMVTFNPTAAEDYSGFVSIETNDPDQSLITIPVHGRGVDPPVIEVTPDSLMVAVPLNDEVTRSITISNSGMSDLVFDIATEDSNSNSYALQFDGQNDYVGINSLSDMADLTIEALVYYTGGENVGTIFMDATSEGGSDLVFDMNAWGIGIRADKNGATLDNEGAAAVGTVNLDHSWHHICWTMTPAVSKIYLDGDLVLTKYESGSNIGNHAQNPSIGRWWDEWSHSGYFNGLIDYIRIWEEARTQTQIQSNMHMNIAGTTPSLIGYWRFDEGEGLVAHDETAGQNDGLLYNGVEWIPSTVAFDDWISIPVHMGIVSAGSEVELDVIFLGLREAEDLFTAEILIRSNDPLNTLVSVPVSMQVDVVSIDTEPALPTEYVLYQNYPNPFNPTTVIRYGLPEASDVRLEIFDLRGRVVSRYSSVNHPAGWVNLEWNGTNDRGEQVSTGVYICRMVAGDYTKTIKMVFLK